LDVAVGADVARPAEPGDEGTQDDRGRSLLRRRERVEQAGARRDGAVERERAARIRSPLEGRRRWVHEVRPAVHLVTEPTQTPSVLELAPDGGVVDVGEPPAGDQARLADVPGPDGDRRTLVDGTVPGDQEVPRGRAIHAAAEALDAPGEGLGVARTATLVGRV